MTDVCISADLTVRDIMNVAVCLVQQHTGTLVKLQSKYQLLWAVPYARLSI